VKIQNNVKLNLIQAGAENNFQKDAGQEEKNNLAPGRKPPHRGAANKILPDAHKAFDIFVIPST
jgi:hypothetical protein